VAVFGLPEAPSGFAHADDVEAGVLHKGDVFRETYILGVGRVLRHVLVVVSSAVEDGGEV
jgi:hypothetical protein